MGSGVAGAAGPLEGTANPPASGASVVFGRSAVRASPGSASLLSCAFPRLVRTGDARRISPRAGFLGAAGTGSTADAVTTAAPSFCEFFVAGWLRAGTVGEFVEATLEEFEPGLVSEKAADCGAGFDCTAELAGTCACASARGSDGGALEGTET